MKSLLSSKGLFLVNIILISIIAGFALSLAVFSCGTPFTPEQTVFAQDTAPLTATSLEDLQSSFHGVAVTILPSVVELRIIEGPGETGGRLQPFDFFFGRPEEGESTPPRRESGLGSAVIVAKQGTEHFAITNEHVAGNASEIKVVLQDGTEYTGRLVGSDPRMDIAVVSFESEDPAIPLAGYGDSDQLRVGDWVLAVGNPFGFASSITAGIVSAKGRSGPAGNISDFIQTDAAINQGNSGGPLVNLRGEIVGINTWISTPSGINVGLGFAMPINNVKKAVADIVAGGEVRYGWLGVEISDLEEGESEELKYDGSEGAVIRQIFNGSPAETAGLFPGDIVVEINGETIRDYRHLSRVVGQVRAGEKADFGIFREGRFQQLDVRIGLRGDESEIQKAYRDMWPGFSVVTVDEETRERHNFVRTGLMVEDVRSGGIPQIAGVQRGDFIDAINGTRVKNLLDFYRLLNDTENEEFDFLLNRSGEEITIGIIRQ